MRIVKLNHRYTTSYLIQKNGTWIFFDAGWPDSYSTFAEIMSRNNIQLEEVAYLFVSHFHPDHCGVVEELKERGVMLLLHETQANGPESANHFFERNPNKFYKPITQKNCKLITSPQSKELLRAIGFVGEPIPTPGHSDDSISLVLDDSGFVGDLPPYDMAKAYSDPVLMESWRRLIDMGVNHLYPAHGAQYSIRKRQTQVFVERETEYQD